MYAALSMVTLGPGMRSTAEKVCDQFAPVFRGLKGFKSMTFMLDDTVGDLAALILWETKEDAKAASAAVGSRSEQAVSGIAKGPITRRVFEVYEPKA